MSRGQRRVFRIDGELHGAGFERLDDEITLHLDDREVRFRIERIGAGAYSVHHETARNRGFAVRDGDRVWVHFEGRVWRLDEEGSRDRRSASSAAADDQVLAPMTGTVLQVLVAEGDSVEAGKPLVVLEAMKMEHVLKAPRDGVVGAVRCRAGEQVDAQSLLVEMAGTGAGAGASEETLPETSDES